MLAFMDVLLAICVGVAGVLAVLNAAQAVLGRQIFRPDRSRRSQAQLRRESAVAAVAMSAAALAVVGIRMRLPFGLILGAILLAGLGMTFIFSRRNRTL
jgi:uncharacterized membrane protein YdfJ with MMPL/SSD domain